MAVCHSIIEILGNFLNVNVLLHEEYHKDHLKHIQQRFIFSLIKINGICLVLPKRWIVVPPLFHELIIFAVWKGFQSINVDFRKYDSNCPIQNNALQIAYEVLPDSF